MKHLHPAISAIASLAFATGACLLPSIGHAQPAGAAGDDFIYNVQAGDTLLHLSQQYTDNPANWAVLQRLNAVQEATLLPIGRTLKIPFAMIPEVPAQARVAHVAGQATANHEAVKVGDALEEGAVIRTGPNGFLTLELADSSTLTIPAGSAVRLERVRVFRGAGLTDTVFAVEEGSLESEVAPDNTGVGRFEVRTPVSITGVRGTRLRVRSGTQGSQSEVLTGRAALSTRGGANQARLNQGQGAAVDASGKMLGVRALLPAPVLPASIAGDQGRQLSFAPVAGAAGYLVRVAGDPAGSRLYSSQRFTTPDITFHAPGSGTYYLMVRAIDKDGVMGPDAVLSFLGQPVLQTSDGSAVSTGFEHLVLLTEY